MYDEVFFKHYHLGEQVDINHLVSTKNETLLNEMISTFRVEFRRSLLPYSITVFADSKNPVFVGVINEAKEEDLSHELLHLKLYSLGFSSDYRACIANSSLVESNLIDGERFFYEMSNTIAHIRMIPLFIDLGYDRSMFYSTLVPNMTSDYIPKARLFLADKTFSKDFTAYLRAYINLRYNRSQENSLHDDSLLNDLNYINRELFDILDKAFTEWDSDIAMLDNKQWCIRMFKNLNDWISTK